MDLRRPSFTDPHRTSSYHSGSSVDSTTVSSSPDHDHPADVHGIDDHDGDLDGRSDQGTIGHVRRGVGDDEFERGVGLLDFIECGSSRVSLMTDRRVNVDELKINQISPLNIPKRSTSSQRPLSSFSSIADHSPDTPRPISSVQTQVSVHHTGLFAPDSCHPAEADLDPGDISSSTLGLGVGDDPFAPVSNSPKMKWSRSPRRPNHQPSWKTIKRSLPIPSQNEGRQPNTSDEEPVGVIAALERSQEDFGDILNAGTSGAFELIAVEHQHRRSSSNTSHIVSSSSSIPRARRTVPADRRHTSMTMRYAMGDSPTSPIANQARINPITSDDQESQQEGNADIVSQTFPRTFVSPRTRMRSHRRRAVSGPLDSSRYEAEDQDLSLDADPPRELGLRFPAISPRRSFLLSPGQGQFGGRFASITSTSQGMERNLSAASQLAMNEYSDHWVQSDDPSMDERSMRRVREEVENVRRRSGLVEGRNMGEDDSRRAPRESAMPITSPGGDSHLEVVIDELRCLRGEIGELRQHVKILTGSSTKQVDQEAISAKEEMATLPKQEDTTIATVPNLPDALALILKLDILVHHLPRKSNPDDQHPNPELRMANQVFSVDNLALLGQTIEDWECVIRGRRTK